MKEAKNELMQFVAGVLMLAVGLYIFSQKVMVTSTYGFFSYRGGMFSSGLIIIPLIIGIVWMFVSGGSFPSKVFSVIAVILIIASVIMSTRIWLTSMSLYEWILILVLIFGGGGLVAKVLFANNKNDSPKSAGKNNANDSSINSVEEELERMKKNMK